MTIDIEQLRLTGPKSQGLRCFTYSSVAISGTDGLEVLTIYKAYVREYPHKIKPYMYSTSDPEITIDYRCVLIVEGASYFTLSWPPETTGHRRPLGTMAPTLVSEH